MEGEARVLPGAKAHLLPILTQISLEVRPSQNWEIPGNQQAFLQMGKLRPRESRSESVAGLGLRPLDSYSSFLSAVGL